MENPQWENGHIDIANEIAKKLSSYHLSGNEWLILWVVFRKTWGWHKKEDAISLTQFERETGLSRPSVKEALNKLVGKKVLVVGKKVLGINVWSFNKYYSQWIVGKKVLVGFSVKLVPKKVLSLVGKKEHTKETTTKETITKDISITEVIDGNQLKKDTNYFIGLFKSLNPSYELLFKNTTQRLSMERLLKKYGGDKLEKMLLALPEITSRKYAPTITTPYMLETKIGDLLMFLRKEKYGQPKIAIYPGP